MAQERKIGNSDKSLSAVDWYAKEHLKLLVQLENKELTLGEYVVKHQDILQKAKSIEDLTSLKKRNTELQDQVLLNDTTKKPMSKNNMTAVEFMQTELVKLKMPIDAGFQVSVVRIFEQAKEMEKEKHDAWNAFLEREKTLGISDVKTIERIQWYYNQYYNETFGK